MTAKFACGHELTNDNTRVFYSGTGHRCIRCIVCEKATKQRRRERHEQETGFCCASKHPLSEMGHDRNGRRFCRGCMREASATGNARRYGPAGPAPRRAPTPDAITSDVPLPRLHGQAACRGMDTEMFFPLDNQSTAPITAICSGCLVRVECLDWALAHGERGIWGGTSEPARREMRRAKRGAA